MFDIIGKKVKQKSSKIDYTLVAIYELNKGYEFVLMTSKFYNHSVFYKTEIDFLKYYEASNGTF